MAKVPPFSDLIAATTRSAVHLELRDTYDPDTPQYREWLAGTPRPVPASREWYDLVREHTARGVRFRRARIVSEPASDYIRFEHEATAGLNVAAGEEVRWLPRRRARGLLAPVNDYWVFDGRLVRFGYFAGDGRYLDDELTDDPATARTCAEAFERVWELAIPHADYRPA
jgi:hypothetical protein